MTQDGYAELVAAAEVIVRAANRVDELPEPLRERVVVARKLISSIIALKHLRELLNATTNNLEQANVKRVIAEGEAKIRSLADRLLVLAPTPSGRKH